MISLSTCLKDISCKKRIKLNKIVNRFLVVGDKFMPEMHYDGYQGGLASMVYKLFDKKPKLMNQIIS